ncbi:hypothetical protein Sjap_016863 [Stephania japonica]|uniref:Homeobox-leucine zipper protein n=1 Tax=Stephania japonica TaxID=461633 RepID=A0AAP0NIR0_9MAGN
MMINQADHHHHQQQQQDHHDQELLINQLYPSLYSHALPTSGEMRPKRRRRKRGGDGAVGMMKKRKLSEEQVNMLEMNFGSEHKLESERKDKLASELGLDSRQVAVWFQNRRARWKSKKLEEEYSKLKSAHESVIVDKCRLEAEVLKLQDQLLQAKKEIQRITEKCSDGGMSISSPCSSFSMDCGSHFLGDIVDEQYYDNMFSSLRDYGYVNGVDYWPY